MADRFAARSCSTTSHSPGDGVNPPQTAVPPKSLDNDPLLVIVAYPLSREFVAKLRHRFEAEPTVLTIGELRALPIAGLLKRLFAIRGRVVLAIENGEGRAIFPLLQLLMLATRAREIIAVDGELIVEKLARWRIATFLLPLLSASISGFLAIYRSKRELLRLSRAPRMDVMLRPASRLLYLKTNLWFGIKAGGSVGHIAGVVKALRRRAYDVDFMAFEQPELLTDDVNLHLVSLGIFGVPAEANSYRLHRAIVGTGLRFSRPDYAFIYHRLSIANYSGVILARRWNIPLILEYNGSEVWVARHWGQPMRYPALAEAAEAACLRHA